MDYRQLYPSDEWFKAFIPENIKHPIISAHEYYKLCRWNLCPRYKINFNNDLIEHGDLVFMNLEWIENYVDWFRFNPPKNKFRAVFHNSDLTFTRQHWIWMEAYTTEIYTINSPFWNEKINPIPMGFNDTSAGVVSALDFNSYVKNGSWGKKQNLCINKFWKNQLRPGRYDAFNKLKEKDFIDTFTEEEWLPVPEYYEQLKTYQYCICPQGQGWDTHRFWECLLFDVVPIIKTSDFTHFLTHFPCYIVDDYGDIRHEFLLSHFEDFYENIQIYKEENPNWLFSTNYIK